MCRWTGVLQTDKNNLRVFWPINYKGTVFIHERSFNIAELCFIGYVFALQQADSGTHNIQFRYVLQHRQWARLNSSMGPGPLSSGREEGRLSVHGSPNSLFRCMPLIHNAAPAAFANNELNRWCAFKQESLLTMLLVAFIYMLVDWTCSDKRKARKRVN